jgi:hypothetical protein
VGQVPGAAKEDDTVDLALCAVPLSRALPAAARLSKPAGLDNKAAVSGQRRPRICIPVYQSLALTRCRYNKVMLILLVLLLVLLFAGLGFALHFLWILAVIFFVFWLAGVALGRGESAGNHHFYRW